MLKFWKTPLASGFALRTVTIVLSYTSTLSLPSQFLALSAHGPECHVEHVGGLLISNSRIQRLLLASIDIHLLSE